MGNKSFPRQGLFLSGLTFFLFLVFGYVSDFILLHHNSWMIADDLIMATAAGIVVFLYERERDRLLSEKLRVLRDMNSFVRNELQILYASTEHLDRARVSTIERSVERIDWALRELLPGARHLEGNPADEIHKRSDDRAHRSASLK